MSDHKFAGKKAPYSLLENIPRLITNYYTKEPDPNNKLQAVSFGTSGHRGSSQDTTFNEDHILAVSQAVADYREEKGITGPLFIGMDSHALSEPALVSAIEVFAANDIDVRYQTDFGYTPTPAISHAILAWNHKGKKKKADGVVITPSHNPPSDGGFKYNATHGGPAGTDITNVIQKNANRHLQSQLADVKRMSLANALKKSNVSAFDYITPYVDDLAT